MRARRRVDELREAIVAGEEQLDADVRALEALRGDVQPADEAVDGAAHAGRRAGASPSRTRAPRSSRFAPSSSELDIARATAEAICRIWRRRASTPSRPRSMK